MSKVKEPIHIKKLSTGRYHIKGLGPCNWSTVPEWPCSEQTIRECAGGEACEEFIKAAARLAYDQAGNHEPDYAVSPGETLLETLEELGMSQEELSTKTGLTHKTINQIVKGKHPLSQDIAIKLDRVTGVPARIWNNLEMKYQEKINSGQAGKE